MTVVKIPNSDVSFYMEDRLRASLDKSIIPALTKKDKDYVLVIDGMEGGGKSTLAFQIGRYVDPTLNLDRICFTADEFKKAIFKAEKGQCIIYDEAFTGLSSRAALSGINRMLVSLMMQMRQKNLFVIVVLPTFFLLDKYVAIFRARCLIHVYESRGIRGYFKLYNRQKKKFLYLIGKVAYSYSKVYTGFNGRFYGVFALGDDKVDKQYRKKKSEALEKVEKVGIEDVGRKFKAQRNWLIYTLKKESDLTLVAMEAKFKTCKYPLSKSQISLIIQKFEEKGE